MQAIATVFSSEKIYQLSCSVWFSEFVLGKRDSLSDRAQGATGQAALWLQDIETTKVGLTVRMGVTGPHSDGLVTRGGRAGY